MYRILVADPLHPAGLALLEASDVEFHLLTAEERHRLAELIPDYDAVIVRSMTRLTADLLHRGERLKVVARAGVGLDNIDVVAASNSGIRVVNAPTANLLSAAEHAFALILALARNVPAADRSMRAGEWDRDGLVGTELHGKTLGIVGYGQIGRLVGSRALAFGMDVLAADPYVAPSRGESSEVELVSLEALLARADFVTVHVPLSEETRGLVGETELARMKPGAMLINCARGGTVDEAALVAALDSGRLAGAAIDVFAVEPPTDRRLARHARTVTTPHIGALTHEARERVAVETVRALLGALDDSRSTPGLDP